MGEDKGNNLLGPTKIIYLDSKGNKVTLPKFINKTTVKTGDNTNIIPFVCIALIAVIAIIIVYRKKKK